MKHEAEIVIIGAGIMGSSVAYNLARTGKKILVLEKDEICSGTSGSTAAWLWLQDKRPDHYMDLARTSMENYKTLGGELGSSFEYTIAGGIELLRNEEELGIGRMIAEEQQRAGLNVRIISPEETLDKDPVVNPNILGAIYSEYDGHVNPFLLVNSYVQAAKRYGAEFSTFTRVEDFVMRGNRIKEIITNKGRITPGLVICAAGIYSKEIGSALGIKIPIHPERGFCLVSERMPKVLNHVHCGARQTVSGNIVFGFNQDPIDCIDRRMYIRGLGWAARDALNDYPGLGEINIIRSYTGIRCKPDDKFPILGPVEKIENFWLAISHSAFLLNCALGPMMAELVNGDRDLKSIPYYTYARFLQ